VVLSSWAEPALGDGDDDQDDQEPGPIASSTSDATGRDTSKHAAFRLVMSVLLRGLMPPIEGKREV
jgi:hypothetical protein